MDTNGSRSGMIKIDNATPKYSVIIVISGNHPIRAKNMHHLIGCLKKQEYRDFETIVIEQICDGNMYWNCMEAHGRYISVTDPVFSWHWCRNVAARIAVGETLIFIDGDVSFGRNYFTIIDRYYSRPCCIGWGNSIWLNEESSNKHKESAFYSTDYLSADIARMGTPHVGTGWGLVNIFNKEFYFDKLGGYNEMFSRQGRGDCEMKVRAENIAKVGVIPYTLIHLWHSGTQTALENREELLAKTITNPQAVIDKLIQAKVGNQNGRISITY